MLLEYSVCLFMQIIYLLHDRFIPCDVLYIAKAEELLPIPYRQHGSFFFAVGITSEIYRPQNFPMKSKKLEKGSSYRLIVKRKRRIRREGGSEIFL